MHILIITQYFWPENFRINDMAVGLTERGHDVTVLTGLPNYPLGKLFHGYGIFSLRTEYYQGVKILRVPIITRGKSKGLRLLFNYLSFVVSASLFGPFKCVGQYDVIYAFEPSPITQCLPAILFKRLKSIPLVLNVQDLWPESLSATGAVKSKFILDGVSKMVKYIYKHCDRIFTSSKGFIDPICKMGCNKDKIFYLPNSAEGLYRPMEVYKDAVERNLMQNGFSLMFAGNIGVSQDFPTLLSAAERLKDNVDIHFVILGDGRQRVWVENEIKARGLSGTVHMLGKFPIEKMPIFFSLADALLVLLKDELIFGLTIPAKVQSYMACAKPMIAALNGSGAEIIAESQSGLVVNSGNVDGLVEIVKKLYKMSASERLAMGKCGRKYFETHFDRNIVLDHLEQWLGELIDQHSKR